MSVAQNKVSAALGRYEVEIKILKKRREREREIERENYYKKNRL